MPNPCNPARRRLLRISACAVASASIGSAVQAHAATVGTSPGGVAPTGVAQAGGVRSGDSPALAGEADNKSVSDIDSENKLKTYHFTAHALGAGVTLAIVHANADDAKQIAALAFAEITRLERIFSLYLQDSTVVELNNSGKLEQPPAELLTVFTQATGIWRATNGAFDPTVQPHWHNRHNPVSKLATYSWSNVIYNASRIEFNKPGMAITLNGIAQGYISEQVAILLRKLGLENVLVDVGEIVAVGNRADGQPWQVGVAELQSDSAEYSVDLINTAIATSAPLNRQTNSSTATGHIIDPNTGRTTHSPWRQLSVIHPSATIADGLSTGLVQMSSACISKALSNYPGAKVLAIKSSGEQFSFGDHL